MVRACHALFRRVSEEDGAERSTRTYDFAPRTSRLAAHQSRISTRSTRNSRIRASSSLASLTKRRVSANYHCRRFGFSPSSTCVWFCLFKGKTKTGFSFQPSIASLAVVSRCQIGMRIIRPLLVHGLRWNVSEAACAVIWNSRADICGDDLAASGKGNGLADHFTGHLRCTRERHGSAWCEDDSVKLRASA